jgi:hypothetical protein
MSKGVMGPIMVTGLVVAVGQGWILSSWKAIYTMTHTGNAAPSTPSSGNAVKPIIGGGDASQTGKGSNAAGAKPNIIPNDPASNPNYA